MTQVILSCSVDIFLKAKNSFYLTAKDLTLKVEVLA